MQLVQFTERGLFCPQGGFYIDPWHPVDKAIITHAHSDHARIGSRHYLCHRLTAPLLRLRLGEISLQQLEWNDPIIINGVKVSLHPAGHIIGSSQVRLEYDGEVWVFSGDYKTENDAISGVFEPVRCNVFISESTFGLPIYQWKPQQEIYREMRQWVTGNNDEGQASIIIGYSLGKAQRILTAVESLDIPIYVHGAIWNVHECLSNAGITLPAVRRILPGISKQELAGSIILAPPSALGSAWMKRFSPSRVAVCSGWMQVRGNVRRRNADAGFALSDHADWEGLLSAIRATSAQRVFVTHGFQSTLSRYLNESGIEAGEVKTEFGTEEEAETTV